MRRTLLLGGIVFLVLAAPASAATTNVTVGLGASAPATVQIDPGDTVHWTFSGPDTNHSVTADAGQTEMFDSDPGNDVPNHMVGDPFDWTFRTPGSFTYYCKVHPFTMKGRVNVGPQPNP